MARLGAVKGMVSSRLVGRNILRGRPLHRVVNHPAHWAHVGLRLSGPVP